MQEHDDALSPRMAELYLERVGVDAAAADKDFLDRLIFAHQCSVPFENIDVYDGGLDIHLTTEKLFDKLVLRRRGGYCFELNGLFRRLLDALGFETRSCLARVLMGRDIVPPPLHRVTLADLGGRLYFCDVGFGGPMPAAAIPLGPGIHADAEGGRFSLEEDRRGWWTLFSHSGGEPSPLISLETADRPEVDFLAPSYYCSHAPESYFVGSRIANLRRPGGSAQLSGTRFKLVRKGAPPEESTAETPESLAALLQDHFGINVQGEGIVFRDAP
ncbi:MAG: arylamine N-acetyltransferase [Spirochaetaceae bacterium]|jgi:N-hydroxyarylamine O-acetyltransferase|nr:arylamine N-acetyltransferase [Spirochaetaceae bacterium]